jgi:hypothetical protein
MAAPTGWHPAVGTGPSVDGSPGHLVRYPYHDMALPRALGRALGRYHQPTIGDAILVVSKGCASEGSTLGFLAKTTLAIPNGQVAVGSRNEISLRKCGWFAMNVGHFGLSGVEAVGWSSPGVVSTLKNAKPCCQSDDVTVPSSFYSVSRRHIRAGRVRGCLR